MNPESGAYNPARQVQNPTDGITYKLIVIQQPVIGAELGADRVVLGRLPILPACIVELVIFRDGIQIPIIDSTTLFCSCTLLTPLPIGTDEPNLVGAIVKSLQLVKNLQGNDVGYFIFDDIGARIVGNNVQLEFTLGEAKPNSPFLARVTSNNFNVVPIDQYPGPGRRATDFYTDLSRDLHERQGVSIYVPSVVVLPANQFAT